MAKKVWFVDFPTYKYKEDVKELARKNDLRILDSKFKPKGAVNADLVEAKPPKLTLKPEHQKADS